MQTPIYITVESNNDLFRFFWNSKSRPSCKRHSHPVSQMRIVCFNPFASRSSLNSKEVRPQMERAIESRRSGIPSERLPASEPVAFTISETNPLFSEIVRKERRG